MCIIGKQIVNALIGGFLLLGHALAGQLAGQSDTPLGGRPADLALAIEQRDQIGGVSPGDNLGGITDRSYVNAPPGTLYVLQMAPGHFLDCGAGQEVRQTDEAGRDQVPLMCGVTMPETLFLPDVGSPAELIIYF